MKLNLNNPKDRIKIDGLRYTLLERYLLNKLGKFPISIAHRKVSEKN